MVAVVRNFVAPHEMPWVEKLALRLCKLIDRNDGKQRQKILMLAREILARMQPVEHKKRSTSAMREVA
jgi:hypothetical protein